MKIILYRNSAERTRVDKTNYLNGVLTLDGYLRNETSVTTPSVIIEMKDAIDVAESNNIDVTNTNLSDIVYLLTEKIIGCNYAYIPDLHRYYFVNDISSVVNTLWRLDMRCDVLMSHKDEILQLEPLIERNENLYNADVQDNEMIFQNDVDVSIYEEPIYRFSGTMNDESQCFVVSLVTKGA